MKKTIKIFLAAAIFSIFNFEFSISFAQDAEYNLIRRTYTLNGNGSIDIRFRKEIKLLRNRAITAYADKGETFILYNPAIDQLTINESYTIRKDGSRVETPANAFIDQLPSQCENCGRYNGIRERVVVHTALEYECTIVLDYTIHRQSPYLEEFLQLTQECPVKKYEVIVDIDGNSSAFGFEEINWDTKVNFISDNHTFHIVANNLPQTYIDSYLPDAQKLYPCVNLQIGRIPLNDFKGEKVPEASNLIAELFNRDSLTHATAIRDYVIDYMHLVDIPMSLAGYRVSTPSETFASGCGTQADKQRLIIALLHTAGIRARNDERGIAVTVKQNGIDLTYILPTNSKRPARLDGVAIDEQRTIAVVDTLPWNGSSIGGGFKQMTLPTEPGGIAIDPAQLTSVRTAPLKVRNCDESYQYTILPPRTPKHLLDKPVDIKYSEKGVGSIRIRITQRAGGAIEVVRQLNINVEDGIVTAKQYKAFRKMMQDWNRYRTITVKAQPGKPLNNN